MRTQKDPVSKPEPRKREAATSPGEVPWEKLAGTRSRDYAAGIMGPMLQRLGNDALPYVVEGMKGMGPTDVAEAMLASQMMTAHDAYMLAALRLTQSTSDELTVAMMGALALLGQLYLRQLDALQRYRMTSVAKVEVGGKVTGHESEQGPNVVPFGKRRNGKRSYA